MLENVKQPRNHIKCQESVCFHYVNLICCMLYPLFATQSTDSISTYYYA